MKVLLRLFAILIILTITFSILVACDQEIKEFSIPDGTKFIAHRGLSSVYYQNTYDAFVGAAESDFFFGIETDIWFTSDNKWVCAHDNDPFADTAKLISEIPYNEAMELPLNLNKAGNIEAIEEAYYLCGFESYLDVVIEFNKMAVIELKCSPTEEQLQELLNIIDNKTIRDRIQFISFEIENIDKINNLDPNILTQVLTGNAIVATSLVASNRNLGINYSLVTENIINDVHSNGNVINLWTVNDESLIIEYMEWGVDYITTDYIYNI